MEKYWIVNKPIQNRTNEEMINEFLLSLKIAGYSEATIRHYRKVLQIFFAEQEDDFSELSSEYIIDWLQTHLGNLKESSFRSYLTGISSFYTFCVGENRIQSSPIKRRWYPRLIKSLPKYLEKEEIAKVRMQAEKERVRDDLLLEFMLDSGARVGEVHLLNKEDVNIEERTARVVGKGNKIRFVHFRDRCAILFEKYLQDAPLSIAMFCTSTGKRLSIRRIHEIIQEVGKTAQLTTNLHPHRLRHTFATELLSKGAELSFIGEEMGHNNLATTNIYARLPNQKIIALYRKFMG